MNIQADILKWGIDYLTSNGYTIEDQPETVLSTPWSNIFRFSTATGDIYLKQTPPAIFREPQIIQLLSGQVHASVPFVIASNDKLHCFLMRNAGKNLRGILKAEFDLELFCRAIKEYGALQRSTENCVDSFIRLGVPDWRLDKLPILYEQMISRTDFLQADGVTNEELQKLQSLQPRFVEQCELLSSYKISATIGIPDFNDNNTLLDLHSKKLSFIDWGEAAITHPFFSILNCLEQAIKHYGVKEADHTYAKLQDACLENWLELATKNELLVVLGLAKQLRIFYEVLAGYRLMVSVDLQALNTFYANNSNRLAKAFRRLIDSCSKI